MNYLRVSICLVICKVTYIWAWAYLDVVKVRYILKFNAAAGLFLHLDTAMVARLLIFLIRNEIGSLFLNLASHPMISSLHLGLFNLFGLFLTIYNFNDIHVEGLVVSFHDASRIY
jgi:hypothetical protein